MTVFVKMALVIYPLIKQGMKISWIHLILLVMIFLTIFYLVFGQDTVARLARSDLPLGSYIEGTPAPQFHTLFRRPVKSFLICGLVMLILCLWSSMEIRP